jgi:hypothetical protein
MAVNVICECGHKHSYHFDLDGECGVAGCDCKSYAGHSLETKTVDRLVPEEPPVKKEGFSQPGHPLPERPQGDPPSTGGAEVERRVAGDGNEDEVGGALDPNPPPVPERAPPRVDLKDVGTTHDEVRERVRNGDRLPGPDTETVPVPDDPERDTADPDRKR